jgi:hypothetical protein
MIATAPTVHFDEATHTYTHEGVVLPSVTTIIKAAGLMDMTGWNEAARDRGTRVAKMTAYFDQGDLDEASVDPAELGYLNAWRRFLSESGFKSDANGIEEVLCVPGRAAGTLDRRGMMGQLKTIIDIKTGGASAWHAIQTAGYASLVGGHHRRYACYLQDDGRYTLVQHRDASDFAIFDACVNLYHWKKRNMAA